VDRQSVTKIYNNLADEGPHARVHGHVARQVVVGVEDLAALAARVALLLASRGNGRAVGAERGGRTRAGVAGALLVRLLVGQ